MFTAKFLHMDENYRSFRTNIQGAKMEGMISIWSSVATPLFSFIGVRETSNLRMAISEIQ